MHASKHIGQQMHGLPVTAAQSWSKELLVVGNRRWKKGLVVDSMSDPEPFTEMPLTYANSFGGPDPDPSVAPPPIDVAGMASRHEYTLGDVDFVQPKALYEKVMTDEDREHLIGNIVAHLGGAQKRIRLRQTALFYKVTPEYGTRVAKGLGLDVKQVERLAAMTQEERVEATKA